MPTVTQSEWVAYWDELSEGQLLFQPEAEEYVRRLTSALPLVTSSRVLDFGCGYGFIAERLAERVGELCLWDAAESMRRRAAERLARFRNVSHIDLSAATAPFDFILVNSVVQYMAVEELTGWLERWRNLLAPAGRIVLSDLIPPGHRVLSDLWSLLTFSLRRGYFLRAMRNVLAERKRYQRAVKSTPLLHVGREQLSQLSQSAGLSASFLTRNLTHFAGRYTAVLTLHPPG